MDMASPLLFQASIIAAFFAGIVALFAPCCITFLLPSYLGSIFKERKRIFLMTLIFALGIASILVPVALGFRLIVSFFDAYHQLIYLIGGIFMILMGITTLFGWEIMSFKWSPKINPKKANAASVFTLGVFSGLTSSCCAPVLLGVLALSAISSSLISAALITLVYVAGMVVPLFITSLIVEKSGVLGAKFWQKEIGFGAVKTQLSSLVAAIVFIAVGILIIIYDYTLGFAVGGEINAKIRNFTVNIINVLEKLAYGEALIIILSIIFLGLLIKLALKNKTSSEQESEEKEKLSECHHEL